MNGVWQEEAKLVSTDGASGDYFGDVVAISETQPLSGPPFMMTWALTVVLYMFLSDGTMEHGRRYRKSPLQMGRLMIILDGVWPYPAILLSLGQG